MQFHHWEVEILISNYPEDLSQGKKSWHNILACFGGGVYLFIFVILDLIALVFFFP